MTRIRVLGRPPRSRSQSRARLTRAADAASAAVAGPAGPAYDDHPEPSISSSRPTVGWTFRRWRNECFRSTPIRAPPSLIHVQLLRLPTLQYPST